MLKCAKEACQNDVYLKELCRIHYKEFNACSFEKCDNQASCKSLCSYHYRVGHFLRNPWSLIHKRLKSKLKLSSFHVENNTQNTLNKGDIRYLWIRDNAKKMQNPTLTRVNIAHCFCKENCFFVDNIANRYSSDFINSRLLNKNK